MTGPGKEPAQPTPEMQAAMQVAEEFHRGVTAYWNNVVVPFAQAYEKAAIETLNRIGKALKDAG